MSSRIKSVRKPAVKQTGEVYASLDAARRGLVDLFNRGDPLTVSKSYGRAFVRVRLDGHNIAILKRS